MFFDFSFSDKKVPIEAVNFIEDIRKQINEIPLKEIVWTKNGQEIKIDEKILSDWEFTGLNNVHFITDEFYLNGFDKEKEKGDV